MDEKSANFAGMVEQYIKEMERYHARRMPEPEEKLEEKTVDSIPTIPMPEETVESVASSEQETQPFPEVPPAEPTNFHGQDISTEMNSSNPLLKEILPTPCDFTDEGYLVIKTFAGDGVIPLEGSDVVVYTEVAGKKELLSLQTTDEEGHTPQITVKTVGREKADLPGKELPYVTCFVNAWAPSYYPVVNQAVDVFGGETSFVEIEMVPLPDEKPGTSPGVMTDG